MERELSGVRLLVVQTGTAAAPLRAAHGDYPQWFDRALGRAMPVVRAHEGEQLWPAVERLKPQGIVVTGSPLSVTAEAPWMLELGGELLRAGERGIHVLGVCFGHQLLARAAGGEVRRNPRGREIGTIRVQLTAQGREDPLFSHCAAGELLAQATHEDAVLRLPDGAVLLASNERAAVQAFRLSETVAGVQFHPELSAAAMRDLILSRRDRLAGEGLDADALAAAVREVDAARLLHAFAARAARA